METKEDFTVESDEFDTSDIDQELSATFSKFTSAQAEVKKEESEAQNEEEESFSIDQFYKALEKKGISRATIEAWKTRYRAIYLFAPSEQDMYVWRPLYKNEWDSINSQVPQGQTVEEQTKIDSELEKLVVRRCLVYPKASDEFIANSRAGLMSTMFNVIMQGSYFFSPQQALSLLVEL